MKNFVLSLFFLLVPLFVSGAGESVILNYPPNKYLTFDNVDQEKSLRAVNIYLLVNGKKCSFSGSLTIDRW